MNRRELFISLLGVPVAAAAGRKRRIPFNSPASMERSDRAAEYIALENTRRILAEVCGDWGRPDLAATCREVTTLQECDDAADTVATACGWWRNRSAPTVEVQDRKISRFVGRTAQAAQQTAFDAAQGRGLEVVAASAAWTVQCAAASRRRAYGAERAAIERKFCAIGTEILEGATRVFTTLPLSQDRA